MIRELSIAELECLMPMAEAFHHRVKLPGKFSATAFLRTWTELIQSKIGFVSARWSEGDPVEAVGVIISGDMFSGEVTACSAFWMFTTPPKGLEAGLLYRHVEDKCAAAGARQFLISTLQSSPRLTAVSMFLVGAGYRKAETTYRKVL